MGMRIRGGAARQLQVLFDSGAIGSLTDAELLARFLRGGSGTEHAFEALVDRHSRMVIRVCFDVLGDPHDAQDAAQATFFILARKARSIRNPDALASWLHGTARRVAGRALRDSIRRRRHERRSVEVKPAATESPRNWSELHEELAKLPERYRDPIILCDLTGLTHEQAAEQLGCPSRTVETRLYRGRERLKHKLVRRGLAPSAALVGVAWGAEVQAAVPASWVAATSSAAFILSKSGGWVVTGQVSTVAVGWARESLRETTMLKLKWMLGSSLLLGLAWWQAPTQKPPVKQPAKVETKPVVAKVQAVPEAPLPRTHTHPITIIGKALDPKGQPIAGARIYLASERADYKRLAEVTSNAQGVYQFQNIQLPIERADTVDGRDQGAFQLFGEADGFGYSYRPIKTYYPLPRPEHLKEQPDLRDPPSRFEADGLITLDLNFPVASRLVGTVKDDQGKPLSGVRLEVHQCTSLIDVDNVRPGWEFHALNLTDGVPPSMKTRITDAEGRFSYEGMPPDCRFWIWVRAEGFQRYSFNAATTANPQPDHEGWPVLTGEMDVILKRPLEIPIKLIYEDTNQPAAKAAIQAAEGYINVFETSDDQGRAMLHLPKGDYRMENWPARGMPYLVTHDKLVVGDRPPTDPLIYRLRRAADLEVIVTDEATGKGLAGVDLWHPTEFFPRSLFTVKSWEVASRLVRRDSPRTDESGMIRAITEPGKQLIGVGLEAYPKGYEVVEKDGQEIECRVGETTTVRFHLRKRP